MEALREAYRQIHVVDDSEGGSSLKGRGMSRPESLPSSPQHPRQSLQPTSTNESGQTPPCWLSLHSPQAVLKTEYMIRIQQTIRDYR